MERVRMRKGFTLIEIMVVIGIIVLLATLAIPNLLRTRINVNESAAIANLQSLFTASQSYWSATGSLPDSIDDLQNATPPYITICENSTDCRKNGYIYEIKGTGNSTTFWIYAYPQIDGTTGENRFCINDEGVVRKSTSNMTTKSECLNSTFVQ